MGKKKVTQKCLTLLTKAPSGLYTLTSQQPPLHAKKNVPTNQISNRSANGMFCLLSHQKDYLKSFIIDSDSWWEAGRRELYTQHSFGFHLLALAAMLPDGKKKPSVIFKQNTCMEDIEFTFSEPLFSIYLNYNWLKQIQFPIQNQGQPNKCSSGGAPQVHQEEHTELF